MTTQIQKETAVHMQKSVDVLQAELARVRTGRASLALLDGVRVDCYGSRMALNQMASLATPDPRTITIQPWDMSLLVAVEKAIIASGLGLTPNNDGRIIRVNIPTLTEERRKELVKQIKKVGEECKIGIRHVRREGNEKLEVAKKKSQITEDDLRRGTEAIQKLTDKFSKVVDEIMAAKEKDIMTV